MEPWLMHTDRRSRIRLAFAILWIGASIGGMAALAKYDLSAGTSESVPLQWPTDSKLALSPHGATLILFAHPRCPCTRATLGELEKIMAHGQSALTVWVVFLKPEGTDETWDRSDLVETAAAIPGVHVVHDANGVEARRFHATTSGQTLLYSNQGKLQFSGGITMARGHAGDNPGRDAIESYLTSGEVPLHDTPVFGCPIAIQPPQN